MATSPSTEITALLQRGITAARSGRSVEARQILEQVVKADPDNEMAWLWLSGLVTTREQKRTCLERVLRANPENVYARAGLARLQDTPQIEGDELETRLAFAVGGNGYASPKDTVSRTQSVGRRPLERLSPPRASNARQKDPSETELPVPEAPGPTSAAPTQPENHSSNVPNPLESVCPACDESVPPAAKMCPYCFMPLRSLDDLLGHDTQDLKPGAHQTSKRKRRGLFSGLGSVIST